MNILVVQFYTKNVKYAEFSTKINSLYCEKHGYSYYVETDTDKILTELNGRSPTWYKPKLILDVLDKFSPEYVLFLDIDAVFIDFEDKIENYISQDHHLLFTDDYSIHSNMNAGVFIVKNTEWSKHAMTKWWDICDVLTGKEIPNLVHPDESRCEAGYFRTALWHDQSCLTFLYQNDAEFRDNLKIITHRKLNWREAFDSNFIYHAFAYGHVPHRNLDFVYSKITNAPLYVSEPEDSLLQIASQFFTDKETTHHYFTRVYTDLFQGLKETASTIVEIGVLEGNSLAIWKNYFTNANIIGIDKNPDCGSVVRDTDRVHIIIADSENTDDLARVHSELRDVDILIDDGGHRMNQQQYALAYLLPCIKDGGLFIIEDLQTSTEARMPEKEIFDWGDPTKTTTLEMLRNYQQTGKIVSDYLTAEQCNMLENMIDSVIIYDEYGEFDSIICVIKKRLQS